ncbi:MAG: hypothetical protein A3F94_02875 [Candidatus Spechtbacteria bacterium RIFCSPLOWO2_12_FULL_38_22]|uniref:Uncharacterized protein n=1 Tax=Candidatus Spechtbacteria bacterium RIFCSPLOWO2_12_FULL_38_22 TaxID=1802165 RepID=A0A1G2HIB7_9BACT|nr:MAG: hypothetical protein A2728_02650 [Candidatus Spechtbacteria bacterium RIFCSPHIGHO2_01_FULL_38_11]OGZ60053.1 MAG: hypothetical protein A3E58_01785 [Candidatus Spechtbacteria bacterium RIFCSPHIGHO2_12_FULL_38_30]OGZ60929.1 MAG: hypothetical protein A3A00_02255 [Candidatus Spechtbacteria bacterium RIFCSPLOWO2_01_FULL_38_20]OGZ62246.1 MAG: hypothetical protein A3F94_02875 [Candidatus Spechtbacteria bacterium RIFCSPLOWO2_12_FULL_38_22]
MKHNLKTLLAFGGLLLGLTLIFVFINRLWDVQDPETFVIKRTDQTTTQWDRILQQKDTENAKIITNVYDGYEITIPKNWLAPQKSPSALRLYSYEQLQYRTEKNLLENIEKWPPLEHEMPIFSIDILEKIEKTPLDVWLNTSPFVTNVLPGELIFKKIKINTLEALKAIQQTYEEDGSLGLMQSVFVVSGKNRVYILTCADDLQKCENAIKTFKILE